MMKKKTLLMSALAVVLAAGMTIAPAMAYFTAHTEASGKVVVELGDNTKIDEELLEGGWTKRITITNVGPGESVYVRAKAIAAGDLGTPDYDGHGGWTNGGDGWYYYDGVLDVDDVTDPALDVKLTKPETAKIGDEVNVTVVYECIALRYNEQGQSIDASGAVIDKPQQAWGSEE